MSCSGDKWRVRDGYRACEYCGSMHPEDLFVAIEAGAMVTGTDKNYKIYVSRRIRSPMACASSVRVTKTIADGAI